MNNKVLVLGGRGLVGSSLVRELESSGYTNILSPLREEVDLSKEQQVLDYFEKEKPEMVINAAAKVGGIHANNTYRGDFILDNLSIQTNVFKAALKNNVQKFIFMGSSCIYPRSCSQPIKEEYLLSSELEPTNEPYAIAKIAGLKTAENLKKQYGLNYFSIMPTNLYGVNDNFHPENSHVIPGLIQRMYKTIKNGDKEFVVWGTGSPLREFLYVDDLAKATIYLLKHEGEVPPWINVGTGKDISIKELTLKIANLMEFDGDIVFDSSKPDGTPRKVLDTSKINSLGWKPTYSLEEGLKKTINFYIKNYAV